MKNKEIIKMPDTGDCWISNVVERTNRNTTALLAHRKSPFALQTNAALCNQTQGIQVLVDATHDRLSAR